MAYDQYDDFPEDTLISDGVIRPYKGRLICTDDGYLTNPPNIGYRGGVSVGDGKRTGTPRAGQWHRKKRKPRKLLW